MYLHYGFFGDLNEYLNERVNALISDKQKGNLQILREYAVHRATVEQNVIMNLVDWRSHFETCCYLTYPTQQDKDVITDTNNVSDSDLMTFVVCINSALKQYVDSYEENKPNCLTLYEFYKLLKNEIENRPSMSFYTAKGDGFQDYLEARCWRHEQNRRLGQARELGNICPNCKSTTDIKSNGNMWHCSNCGYNWRKKKPL
jgi:ribosomal protein S27AE